MKFIILFLLSLKCWGLHIYESYSQPYSIRPIPHVFMTPNDSRALDLFDFFLGFNLSFFFYDLKDPYITASSSPTINYFEKKPFKSGFIKVIEMGSFTVILANPNQIYTAIIGDNQGELSFSVQDFLNIDNQYLCSNILAVNETVLLIDCVQNNTINGYFLTVSLDDKFKFIDESLISSTYSFPSQNNSEINNDYMACKKEMRFQNSLLFRFCNRNPRVSGFFEVFTVEKNGIIQKASVINRNDVDIELFIVDIAIYQVESANNFKIFLLDQLFGPCSINYFNNTIELLTDFPSILGENYYFLRFDPIFYIVYVVSSHYISGISLSFDSSAKKLYKRVNFGTEMEILNFDFNDNYFLVHTKQENSTFLNIYSKNTQNTRFLYKISLNFGESFINLQLEENKGLFIYNSLQNEYRLISLGNSVLQVSCCQGAIPSTYLPYNRTLTFLVSASDEMSGQVTQISANLNISIVKNNMIFDDYMGFRLFVVNPRSFAPEHEFFFSSGEVPDAFKMIKALGFYCDEDRFSLGIKDNEKNYAVIPGTTWQNSLHDMQSQILDSSKTLPLLNVDEMVVTCNINNSILANTYKNPLVLGYLDDIFFNNKIDKYGELYLSSTRNEIIDIQTNILDFDGETFIHLKPNLTSIIANFSQDFLYNYKNNITLFELKKQDSLNLEGFYDGFVEDYIFEFKIDEDNDTNTTSYLDDYARNSVFLQKYIEFSSNESNSLFTEEKIIKSLLYKDFAFILTETMVYIYGIPPLYQKFTQIDSVNLSKVSVLFDYCNNVFIHDNLQILLLFCESKSNSEKPKRLIFIDFSSNGFENILKQAPLPSYINLIEKCVFLENLLFIIEKKVDSLNECFIHVFLMKENDLIAFPRENLKEYTVFDIIFENYKRMDAESFDVDYLILKNLQIKLMGKLNTLMVIGILMNDMIGLYYTEFTVNTSNETRQFIGDLNKLRKIRLKEIVGNYSHDLPLNNGFFWSKTDDFGCLKLMIYNEYNLIEVQISRFYWESVSIIKKYQGFYDCFHRGIVASNDQYLLEFCEISEQAKILLALYVKKNKDLILISQTLSFSKNTISDILLKGNYLLIMMNDGSFLKYNIKQGISLERNYTMKGNSLFFGTLTAQNRFSNSSVVITIKPEILNDEKLDIAFLFLIVFPIVLSIIGFISLLIYIYFRKKKRKEEIQKKFLKEIY